MNLSGWKKFHKNFHAFFSGMNTICLSGPTYALICVNGSSELGFSEIFDFSSPSIEPKIYLYLMDSKIFGCSEKLWVWIVHFWGLWCPGTWSTPLPRENVKRVSAKIQIGPPDLMCTTPHLGKYNYICVGPDWVLKITDVKNSPEMNELEWDLIALKFLWKNIEKQKS